MATTSTGENAPEPACGFPRPLRAIRLNCLGCSETLKAVRDREAPECPLFPYRMGRRPLDRPHRPVGAIRAYCLECCDGKSKSVLWCTCDGLHSTPCHLWVYRFGCRPRRVRARYGPALITPSMMRSAYVPEDDLPNGMGAATSYLAGEPGEVDQELQPARPRGASKTAGQGMFFRR